MDRRALLLAVLLLAPLANADKKVAWHGPDSPVYVVTQNHYAEGFSPEGKTARFGDLIAIEIFNPKPRPQEQDAVYTVGENLSLFMGGERRGGVSIKQVLPLQCDSNAALVAADPSIHLTKDDMALATNAKTIRPHANGQRQPNETERKYAQDLAIAQFRRHAVYNVRAKDVEIHQLFVTKVDDSDELFLIGSLFVKTKDAIHSIFLIGKIGDAGATAELASYSKTTDVEDGTDSVDFRFVDQLDLDGDGTDEIVVEVRGYESEEFRIYQRHLGFWRQVHTGGGGGC
jgi:hypothetical protein